MKFSGEAFVMFENTLDVELALGIVDGKRLQNTYIKVFRSSAEQFQYYCDPTATTFMNKSERLPNGRINSVPNLGKPFFIFFVKYG